MVAGEGGRIKEDASARAIRGDSGGGKNAVGTRECRNYRKSKNWPRETIIDRACSTIVFNALVDRDGSARGLDETVVGATLAAYCSVLAGVLDSDSDAEDADRDLLAVEADSAVENLVEGKAETGERVLGLLALLLLVSKVKYKRIRGQVLCSSRLCV